MHNESWSKTGVPTISASAAASVVRAMFELSLVSVCCRQDVSDRWSSNSSADGLEKINRLTRRTSSWITNYKLNMFASRWALARARSSDKWIKSSSIFSYFIFFFVCVSKSNWILIFFYLLIIWGGCAGRQEIVVNLENELSTRSWSSCWTIPSYSEWKIVNYFEVNEKNNS